MTKRILFVTRKWPPAVGGMETYSKRLSEELSRNNDVEVLALPGRSDGRPPSALSLVWFGLRVAIRILRLAPQFDVIHGADMAIWPLVALARIRNPHAHFALSAHGTDVAFAVRSGMFPRLYKTYLLLAARSLPDAKILANSRATASLLNDLRFIKVAIVPLAGDCTTDKPGDCDGPRKYVLFVGRLIERKGCAWFIRNVLPKLPATIRVKVAGTVVDQNELPPLRNERVDYLGPVFGKDLAKLRSNAIAVIIPNIAQPHNAGFEGFGLTAVEGAADGSIVLASAVDGISDAVMDNETGFLLPPGDTQAWCNKILEVSAWSPERRMEFADAAKSAVRSHYSWERVACDTTAAYFCVKQRKAESTISAAPALEETPPSSSKKRITFAIGRLPPLFTGPVARSAYSTSALRIHNIALGFLTTVIIARFLGAEGLGIYAFGASITMMAAVFSRQGVQTEITRLTAVFLDDHDWPRLKGVLQFGVAASLVGTTLCSFLAAIYLAITGTDSALVQAGVFGAALAPVLAVSAVFQGRMRGNMQNLRAYTPEFFVAPVVTLMLTGVFALLGVLTARMALVAFAVGWIVASLISFMLAHRILPAQMKRASATIEWKNWLLGAILLTAASLISVTAGRIELVALSSNFGAAELGLYAIAFRFAQITTLPGFALSSGFSPILAKLHARNEAASLERRIKLSAWMNFFGSLAMGIALSGGSWVLLPLLNPELAAARPLVLIMCGGFILQSLFGRAGDVLSMLGLARVAAKASLCTFMFSVVAVVLFVPNYGAAGAATITALTFIFHGVLLSVIAARKTGHRCDVFAEYTQLVGRRAVKYPAA